MYIPIDAAPLLLAGLLMTLKLLICASFISFSVGILLGTVSCTQLANRYSAASIGLYVFITRGVPLYVQLLIAYFVLPDILHINIPAFFAAILALGLCSSGYVTEIIRSGINNIPSGQWEAAHTLGYTTYQTLWLIILPQVVRSVLPTLANELESLLKSTAILSTIGLMELTKVGSTIVARSMIPVPTYILIAGIYLLMSVLLKGLVHIVEQHVFCPHTRP
jgi:His/Glu/Gln/Arg/opine family amino acid ABC transporter permease subunit